MSCLYFACFLHCEIVDEDVQPAPLPLRTAASADAGHSQLGLDWFRIELPALFTGKGLELFSSWIQRFEVALDGSTAQLESKAARC